MASESRLWKSRKAKPASQLSHSLDYYDFLTGYEIRILRARSLGSTSNCMFARMEAATQRVAGQAQQVLFVDLSRFAAEVGDYERARIYLSKACEFDLSSWELYNARLIEGLIALNTGRVDEAVRCLALSTSACLAYENARAKCCVRAPSLELAGKLLDSGKHEAVRGHLLVYREIWDSLQPQIDCWLQVIDKQGKPNFQYEGKMGVPEKPSYRLRMQWMSACCLAEGPVSAEDKATPPRPPAERRARHEQWMAENQHILSAGVSKTIAYLDKGLDIANDQPPSKPEDSSQPSEPAS